MLCLEKGIKEALLAGRSIVDLISSFYNLCNLSLVVSLEGLEKLITSITILSEDVHIFDGGVKI